MFVIIPDVLKGAPDIEQKVFGDGVEILVADTTHANQISEKEWRRCDIVLAWDKLKYDKPLLEKMEKINNDKDSTFILCEYDLEDEFSYNMLIKPYWLAMMKYGKPEYKTLIEEVISYQEKLSLLL